MKTLLHILLVMIWVAIMSACNSGENRFAVRLDEETEKIILDYIKENKIDRAARIITATWVTNTYRKDLYISNIYPQANENVPTYYSVINGNSVVFV
jgi:hypothetical protein